MRSRSMRSPSRSSSGSPSCSPCWAAAAGSTRAMGGRGAALDAALTYSNVVFVGRNPGVGLQLARQRDPRTGNMAVPAVVTCAGDRARDPVVAVPDLRLGTVSGDSASPAARWRLLAFYAAGSARPGGLPLVGRSVVRPALGGAGFRWPLFGDILRVGGGRRSGHGHDQSHDRHRHRLRRTVRLRGDRGLRHGLASRIPADSARIRLGGAAGRDGRHQHRRGAARARFAGGVDRRGDRRRPDRNDRPLGRRASRTRGSRCSTHDPAMLAAGSSYLQVVGPSTDCSGWHGPLFRLRRAPGGCSGPCSPT